MLTLELLALGCALLGAVHWCLAPRRPRSSVALLAAAALLLALRGGALTRLFDS